MSINLSDYNFDFPEELIATEPIYPCRVLFHEKQQNPNREILFQELLEKFLPGDVLVINNTKVLKRRIFTKQFEILFLNQISDRKWNVLFPAQKLKIGDVFELPAANLKQNSQELPIMATLVEKGRPQILEISIELTEEYFQAHAEIPLPPYIQEKRSSRHSTVDDSVWYQTAWASVPGSLASPTASLHFQKKDLEELKAKGVHVCEVTLHVGLGTFLPLTEKMIEEEKLHTEHAHVPAAVWKMIQEAQARGSYIWALGTTVTRTLESVACGRLQIQQNGDYWGETDLFIQPGFQWQVVQRLMTNFHFPKTSLLALVASFASVLEVKSAYQFAIERKFRLFSYGDLSVWVR